VHGYTSIEIECPSWQQLGEGAGALIHCVDEDDYDDLLWSSRKAQTTERRDTAVTPVRK